MALVAPGTWLGYSRCRGPWGMFQSKAYSKQQFLEGILPLGLFWDPEGNSPKCWSSVSLSQAVFPGCALSLSCPLSLGSVGLEVAVGPRAALGENNPEPQLGQLPQFLTGLPRSLPALPCGSQSHPVWSQSLSV